MNLKDRIRKISLSFGYNIVKVQKNVPVEYPFPIKIMIGAADKVQPGWFSAVYPQFDLLDRSTIRKFSRGRPVAAYMAEHVLEHLIIKEGLLALKNIYDSLSEGGRVRIAVPDGLHPDKDYIEEVKVGGTGPGADDHKVLYTYKSLSELLEGAGFSVGLLEYWDENGEFHCKDYNIHDGLIWRSLKYNPLNQDGLPNYTSLIVDGFKHK